GSGSGGEGAPQADMTPDETTFDWYRMIDASRPAAAMTTAGRPVFLPLRRFSPGGDQYPWLAIGAFLPAR
ncbi:MAG: hypothetical protein QNI97_07280, partial [Desulfobacterales bacterium]|nr:hypothetical protein [Desulfobacterales bacterium]